MVNLEALCLVNVRGGVSHEEQTRMRRQRPSVLDLTRLDVERLGVALRELADVAAAAPYRVVLDLGPRRVLAAEVVEALLAAHRAIAGAGGRSAVVVGPALAAQLAVAYPEGITFAADAAAGLIALGGDDPSAAVEVVRRPDRVLLRVAGVLDVRGLRAVQPVLDQVPAITGAVVI